MTRLKQAWLALCGRLEPERVEVVREVERVAERLIPVGDNFELVYRAGSRDHQVALENYKFASDMWRMRASTRAFSQSRGYTPEPDPHPELPVRPEWDGRIYQSCAEVFAAHGENAEARAVKAFIVGDKAYEIGGITEHSIQPKPKIAKGSKRGG
jgi:hypothetical protein